MMRQFCIVIWGCSFLVSVQHKKVAHHAIWLHSRSRVHRVPKQTIPGHFQTHHPCHHHSRVNACVKTNKKEFSWNMKSLKCVNQVLTLCDMHINYEYIKKVSKMKGLQLFCYVILCESGCTYRHGSGCCPRWRGLLGDQWSLTYLEPCHRCGGHEMWFYWAHLPPPCRHP